MKRATISAVFALAAICGSLALAACSSLGGAAQIAEKGDIAASDTYLAVALSLNAYESVPGADAAAAEVLRLQAWHSLLTERQVYSTTGAVDFSALTAIAAQVRTLTGH